MADENDTNRQLPGATSSLKAQQQPRRIQVHELMGNADRLILIHEGAEYTLRVTSKGRLILTK